jgi:hypothetical protein
MYVLTVVFFTLSFKYSPITSIFMRIRPFCEDKDLRMILALKQNHTNILG